MQKDHWIQNSYATKKQLLLNICLIKDITKICEKDISQSILSTSLLDVAVL